MTKSVIVCVVLCSFVFIPYVHFLLGIVLYVFRCSVSVCTFGIFKLFFDYYTEQMIDKIDNCALQCATNNNFQQLLAHYKLL